MFQFLETGLLAKCQGMLRSGEELLNVGRWAEARQKFQTVLTAHPEHPVALHGMGMTYARSGVVRSALLPLQRAVRVNPRDTPALINLANALIIAEAAGDAIPILRRALAIVPDDSLVHNGLGNAYKEINQADSAILAFRRAIALHPDQPDAYTNYGTVLVGIGATEAGIGAHDRAIRLAPHAMAYLYNIGQAKRMRPGDRHFEAMLAASGDLSRLDNQNQIELHFGLGKAYVDLDQPALAMAHFHAGNRLKRQRVPYDEASILGLFDRVRTVFTKPLIDSKAGLGDRASKPIFIVGMPRSGSTLIGQILSCHSRVFVAGETVALALALGAISQTAENPNFPECLAGVTPAQLVQTASAYCRELRRVTAKPAERVVDKLLANFLMVGLIYLIFPSARVIHAMRDPIDACLSHYCQNFRSNHSYGHDLATLGRYYRAYEGVMAHWRGVLPDRTILDVRYEDVVADLEGQTRRILTFCELPWEEDCLSFFNSRRLVRTASAAQVHQPIYDTSIRRWEAYAPFLGPLIASLGKTERIRNET